MKISQVTEYLETVAPLQLQEDYDNAGLITGSPLWECTGVLIALDVTEDILLEAEQKHCNMVVSHHPIVFRSLKKITGNNYVERIIISAIKKDIALYAIHTNLDNVIEGVNGEIANRLGLKNISILQPMPGLLKKLVTFVPPAQADKVREALFNSGAGNFSKYDHVSYNSSGTGTFTAKPGAQPFVGAVDQSHSEEEIRMEVILPAYLQSKVIAALLSAHPYEEVAYDVISLENNLPGLGTGVVGHFDAPIEEAEFLMLITSAFGLKICKHTKLLNKKINKVAVCGGSGSFLIQNAINIGADAFVTADIRYHDFFDADGKILLVDIGHYESEQFTIDLLTRILRKKFPNFAVQKTKLITNPVNYFLKG